MALQGVDQILVVGWNVAHYSNFRRDLRRLPAFLFFVPSGQASKLDSSPASRWAWTPAFPQALPLEASEAAPDCRSAYGKRGKHTNLVWRKENLLIPQREIGSRGPGLDVDNFL